MQKASDIQWLMSNNATGKYRSYLQLVQRYKFLILDACHPDGAWGSVVVKALRY